MTSRVISEDGLTRTEDGFDVDIRLPWYRALPLSTVDVPEVAIDGEKICSDCIRLEVNGKIYTLDELRTLEDQNWFVLDSAHLRVRHEQLAAGSEHTIDVTVALRPPYIKGFVRMTHASKVLRAA